MNTGHMITINATDFKAKCLAILDQVHETGERIVILKRGKPVAELSRVTKAEGGYPQDNLKGTVIIKGDILAPVLPEEDWEVLK